MNSSQKKSLSDTLDTAESRITSRLGWKTPKKRAHLGFDYLPGKQAAGYFPKFGKMEDVYIFTPTAVRDDNNTGIIYHEATHRTHLVNRCNGHSPSTKDRMDAERLCEYAFEQGLHPISLKFMKDSLEETLAYVTASVMADQPPPKYRFSGKGAHRFMSMLIPETENDLRDLIYSMEGELIQNYKQSPVPSLVGSIFANKMLNIYGQIAMDILSERHSSETLKDPLQAYMDMARETRGA